MEFQLIFCLVLDMVFQRIFFFVVLFCIIVVMELFVVVRFWRLQGSIIENKGKKNGNVNKMKEKYICLLYFWCLNKKGNVICICLFFFVLDGKNNNKFNNKNNMLISNEMEIE